MANELKQEESKESLRLVEGKEVEFTQWDRTELVWSEDKKQSVRLPAAPRKVQGVVRKITRGKKGVEVCVVTDAGSETFHLPSTLVSRS